MFSSFMARFLDIGETGRSSGRAFRNRAEPLPNGGFTTGALFASGVGPPSIPNTVYCGPLPEHSAPFQPFYPDQHPGTPSPTPTALLENIAPACSASSITLVQGATSLQSPSHIYIPRDHGHGAIVHNPFLSVLIVSNHIHDLTLARYQEQSVMGSVEEQEAVKLTESG